jgi:hypothetical protein
MDRLTTPAGHSNNRGGPFTPPRWTSQQPPMDQSTTTRGTSPQPRWTSLTTTPTDQSTTNPDGPASKRPRRTSPQPRWAGPQTTDGPSSHPDGLARQSCQSNQHQRTNQQPQGTVDYSGEPLDIPAPRGKVACPDDPSPEDPTRSTPSVTKVSRGTTGFALPH